VRAAHRILRLNRFWKLPRKFHGWSCNRSREHITPSRNRPDQLLRIVIQGLPDFDDTLREGIVHHSRVRPNRPNQRIFGDQATVMLDEIGKHLERFRT
jgi:hypothetical protein